MKIAVLGGGGAGCGAALELASAGQSVDIYETRNALFLGASRVNEGKIHLGHIYAKDDPDLTARTMISGALSFEPILGRWLDTAAAIRKSTPFIYALHKDSQVDAAHFRSHLDRCCKMVNERLAATSQLYLGSSDKATFRELPAIQISGILDDAQIEMAFQTTEYAVDPRPIADALTRAVHAQPRIQVRLQSHVCAVDPGGRRGYFVRLTDGRRDGPYDQVVNATWEGRLPIDASLGLPAPKSYSIRHKYGHRIAIDLQPDHLPSVTTVLGAYGDIVNFGKAGFFLSWYPEGMTSMAANSAVDASWHCIPRDARLANFRRSLAVWKQLCPPLEALQVPDEAVDPASGMIYAHGDTDIDAPDSKLHARSDVGIQSLGGYHSVNTGKYTLFPQAALEVARRVLGTG